MATHRPQPQEHSLPGARARANTARWILRGYILLALVGTTLHIEYAHLEGKPVSLVYITMTLGFGSAAALGLYKLPHSLNTAMLIFGSGTLFCTGVLLYDALIQGEETLPFIIMLLTLNITLGLTVGFRMAMGSAIASSLLLITAGIISHDKWDAYVFWAVLSYAVAFPSKIVEQLIKQSTEDLEHLVQVRTAELLTRTEELARANRILTQRNQELDAFAHTVAHDLKNPLTLLIGFGELLRSHVNTLEKSQIEFYAKVISKYGRKMNNIVDELLLLASTRQLSEVKVATLNMGNIIPQALERLVELIETHQPEILYPEAWPPALGYAPWVEEVWTNYLSNAIKYGGSPPRLELGATELAGGRVCYWIKDNGKGITQEEQEKLFTEFSRLEQTSVEGHGLGLSIVRRIIERMEGEVSVESEPGHGSKFMFTLPAAPPQDTSTKGDLPSTQAEGQSISLVSSP